MKSCKSMVNHFSSVSELPFNEKFEFSLGYQNIYDCSYEGRDGSAWI